MARSPILSEYAQGTELPIVAAQADQPGTGTLPNHCQGKAAISDLSVSASSWLLTGWQMPVSVKVPLLPADAIERRAPGLFKGIVMSSANAELASKGFMFAVKIARFKRPSDREWVKNLDSVADRDTALPSGNVVRLYFIAILDGIHFLGSIL